MPDNDESAGEPLRAWDIRTLTEMVRREVADVLGRTDIEWIESHVPFSELGFDSLRAVALRDRLAARTGLELSAGIVFDHPSVARMAEHLLGEPDAGKVGATAPQVGAPIAVVGMACRYPGAVASADDLWLLVRSGADAITEFPADRGWDVRRLFDPDNSPGTCYSTSGGFLADAGGFDAEFFGISPREAIAMDPQQRLFLETSWEALEHAGIEPSSLRRSRTGVYTGLAYHDYLPRKTPQTEGFWGTGSAGSVASGRVAYELGLEGPAITVDTACSSSLVAIHLAMQALRQGECSLALAGGVTVMATPDAFVEFSQQHGLARDGRCKSFSADADGTGWSEGVGVVVVERLDDAIEHGHTVLAVLRGSAVNSDGTSNGLTAPNGPAQERVIRAALADAGLSPHDIDAVEAHGTGTRLGDPIEAHAVLRTYGRDRSPGRPLWLGSIKSNLGHAQAAAGVAGVIKMIEAIRHTTLPRSLHITEPTAGVDWSAGNVRLLTEARDWPGDHGLRRAAVSSFGLSGTNAHLIVEESAHEYRTADEQPAPTAGHSARETAGHPAQEKTRHPAQEKTAPCLLSGASARGLRGQAAKLLDFVIDRPQLEPAGLAPALATTRAALRHRAALVCADRAQLLDCLADVAAGRARPGAVISAVATPDAGTALLFTGQGAQRSGMGRQLHAAFPVFAAAFDAAVTELDRHLDRGLREIIWAEPKSADAALIDSTVYAQAGLFAFEVALYRLVESWGIAPDFVAGHSIGELAAAHVAGLWSLADAARLVAARGVLMQSLPAGGVMAGVRADPAEVASRLIDGAEIAAVNSPRNVVLSGTAEAVAAVVAGFEADGRQVTRLRVSHAFHSALMEPILGHFADVARDLTYCAPTIPIVSTVTGEPADPSLLCDPGYWVAQIRKPVRYADSVAALVARGVRTFIEIGPAEALSVLGAECVQDTEAIAFVSAQRSISAQRGTRAEVECLVEAVARAHTRGVGVDWTAFFGKSTRADLPTYAFQHRRYWIVPEDNSSGAEMLGHPFLTTVVELADGQAIVASGQLSPLSQPWLLDHRVHDRVVVPGTVFVELAIAAGDRAGCGRLDELTIGVPLILPESAAVAVQAIVGQPDGEGRRAVAIFARAADRQGSWVRHATGRVVAGGDAPAGSDTAAECPAPGAIAVGVDDIYRLLAAAGLGYGPAFRRLSAVWRDGADLVAEVGPVERADAAAGFGIHPVLLDGAVHAIGSTLEAGAPTLVPLSWRGVTLHATGATRIRVRLTHTGAGTMALRVTDPTGRPVLTVEELVLRPMSAAQLAAEGTGDRLFQIDWTASAHRPPTTAAILRTRDHNLAALVAIESAATGSPTTDSATTNSATIGSATIGSATIEYSLAAVGAGETVLVRCPSGDGEVGLARRTRAAVRSTLDLVQAWLGADPPEGARLVVLTTGAVAARPGEQVTDPAQAAAAGLVRSAAAEHPGRLAVLDIDDDPLSYRALAVALASPEPQLALRAGTALVPRLTRMSTGALALPSDGPNWRIDVVSPGTTDGLGVLECPSTALQPGEVRVAVRATGVNFRDVLKALDLYPGDAGPLGREMAGVVVEAGAAVANVVAGERVMGLASGACGPEVVVDARQVTRIPDDWTFARAASVPMVFLTAYYALHDLAAVQPGETVLIHSAAGGVGMAATQLAQHFGAEVFGTAHRDKWHALRRRGIDNRRIASSRDLEFEEAFRAASGGRGVDVVLDSLAGEFVDASLRLLPRGGRFIEMGKTDVRDPLQVAATYSGVRYRAFDLDEAGPDRIGRMLTELMHLFEQGRLAPLPMSVWPMARASEALRPISQGRHVGKTVLTLPPALKTGTVVVTGASGALGALFAEHLVAEYGVRSLLLISRRGGEAPEAQQLQQDLAARGATVTWAACDVTDRAQLADALSTVPAQAPLVGIVHAAGILDDGVIGSLTGERIDAVLAPKVDGAWHLHELTAGADLALFAMFSSAAGIFGTPGQGSYAAANAFLDALVEQRRASGLPGVSLAWGPWDRGMTGQLLDIDRKRLARLGMRTLSPATGIAAFDQAIGAGPPVVVPADVDLSEAVPPVHPLLRTMPTSAGRPVSNGSPLVASLANRLAGRPRSERQLAVMDFVTEHVASVLLIDPAELDTSRAFSEIGMNSLTAVELRNRIDESTAFPVPSSLVFDYPTPAAVAHHLLTEFEKAEDGADPVPDIDRLEQSWRPEAMSSALAHADVETATDDEIFALLDDELGNAHPG